MCVLVLEMLLLLLVQHWYISVTLQTRRQPTTSKIDSVVRRTTTHRISPTTHTYTYEFDESFYIIGYNAV